MAHLQLAQVALDAQDVAPTNTAASVNGAVVDMAGWAACKWTFNLGAMANGSTFAVVVQNSANANMSGAVNIPNAALASVANTGNTNVYLLDVWSPTYRYVQALITIAGGNVAFGSTTQRYRRIGELPQPQSAPQVVIVAEN